MPFELEIVPRYWETDQQNVVFNMWYLAYLTMASESFFDHIGHPIPGLFAEGVGLQLVHAGIDWVGALRWGETATIAVSCERIGSSSLTLRFDVSSDGPVVRASCVYVLAANDGSGKREIPAGMRAALERELSPAA
jgi:acyl-CoA thioester hydrolase